MRSTIAWRLLSGLIAVQLVVYGVIARLSNQFGFNSDFQQRPIPSVVGWFAVGFCLYAASLWTARQLPSGQRISWVIVLTAVAFRAIMLDTKPIQEIDIYRYLWDGAVTSQGISPFRFVPATIRDARASEIVAASDASTDLARLVQLRDRAPGLAQTLSRIHYAELTTAYPPTSQAVFAVADRLTPSQASLVARVTVMKGVLLSFDLGTIGLVACLVVATGRHIAWVICYAWCPLVIKEFANSGHLDSIAVFLTTAAILAAIRTRVRPEVKPIRWQLAAATLLGLSVGAKLYAVVLLPVLTIWIFRTSGRVHAVLFAGTAIFVSTISLAPMFWPSSSSAPHSLDESTEIANRDPPPLPLSRFPKTNPLQQQQRVPRVSSPTPGPGFPSFSVAGK